MDSSPVVGAIMAEVVTSESVLFEGSPLTHLTVEEIYEELDKMLEDIHCKDRGRGQLPIEPELKEKEKQIKKQDKVFLHLFELYRRNISIICSSSLYNVSIDWWNYDVITCSYCVNSIGDDCWPILGNLISHCGSNHVVLYCSRCGNKVMNTNETRPSKEIEMELRKKITTETTWEIMKNLQVYIRKNKDQLKIIKQKMISLNKPKEKHDINAIIDSILDANGNKISEFKEYLSPEHYRLLRAGQDMSEIENQNELLSCLKKMNKIDLYK